MHTRRIIENHYSFAFIVIILILSLGGAADVSSECETYQDSRTTFDSVSGLMYCGGTGRTCTECNTSGGSGGGGVGTCWVSNGVIICGDGNGGYYLM